MTDTEKSPDKAKKKVHRSPSYPVFDLAEAIQKAAAVYQQEKRSATTPEVLASHMGYSQATGPGGRAVSALRQYGLIEEKAGRYQISDGGYTLIHFDRDSEEWKRAISEAARRPILFRELLEKFHGELPSDATLKNELLSRGFNPSSVSDVVSIIRTTMSLASEAGDSYSGEEELSKMPDTAQTAQTISPLLRPSVATMGAELSVPVDFASDTQHPVVARVMFNAPIKREYLTRLKAFLEAWEKTFPEA